MLFFNTKSILVVLNLVVICFSDIFAQGQRISEKKCAEYKNLFREEYVDPIFTNLKDYDPVACPIFSSNPTIIGGRDAEAYEYPAMASLMYPSKKPGQLVSKCGGVLISEQYVLTAAHCFKFGNPKKVSLGDISNEPTRYSLTRIDSDIAQIIKHEKYKPPAAAHDIALIKLAKPVFLRFGVRQPIRPACLQQTEIPLSASFNATGFGKTETHGTAGAAILQTVDLPNVDRKKCSDHFRDSLDFPHRFPGVSETEQETTWVLQPELICAGGIEDKDTCQGDSGGPLFYSPDKNFPCHRYVVGVTSFGSAFCGIRTPGVYTKISAYIDWIEKHVWPNNK